MDNLRLTPPYFMLYGCTDEKFAIGTLNKERFPQISLDIILVDETVVISHTGKSQVHLTGYKGISFGEGMDDDDEDDYEGYGMW